MQPENQAAHSTDEQEHDELASLKAALERPASPGGLPALSRAINRAHSVGVRNSPSRSSKCSASSERGM